MKKQVPLLVVCLAASRMEPVQSQGHRVAHLRRRSGEQQISPARPDQRIQFQQARSRLALQDR